MKTKPCFLESCNFGHQYVSSAASASQVKDKGKPVIIFALDKAYKIKAPLFSFIMFMVFSIPSFSQEKPKLTLLHQDWIEKNPLSSEEETRLSELGRTFRKIAGPGFNQHDADDETLKAFAKILWPDRTKNENSALHMDKITLEENAIPGYLSTKLSNPPWEGDHVLNFDFQVDPSQFEQTIDTQYYNSNLKTGVIRVKIYFGKSAEDVLVQMFRQMMSSSSMDYADILRYYQLKQGPGDACLVDIGRMRPNERKIILIRGNVVVSLRSPYKNFGCMDLAYRLDALLVEQFEQGQRSRYRRPTLRWRRR